MDDAFHACFPLKYNPIFRSVPRDDRLADRGCEASAAAVFRESKGLVAKKQPDRRMTPHPRRV